MTRSGTVLILWILLAFSAVACSSACRLQGTGTVRLLEMEGGFYGIETDAGDHYRPVNLPESFASHGLRVRFCADPVKGLMGIQMWGVPVEILEIETAGSGADEPRNDPGKTP